MNVYVIQRFDTRVKVFDARIDDNKRVTLIKVSTGTWYVDTIIWGDKRVKKGLNHYKHLTVYTNIHESECSGLEGACLQNDTNEIFSYLQETPNGFQIKGLECKTIVDKSWVATF